MSDAGQLARSDDVIVALPMPSNTAKEELIELWLSGKSLHTVRTYRREMVLSR